MSQPAPELDRFSYGDYRRWPDDQRWELIRGEAYDMSPAPTRVHQERVVEFFGFVTNRIRSHGASGGSTVRTPPPV